MTRSNKKKLNKHQRRKLSEEGKRLLYTVLSNSNIPDTETQSIDYSVVTNSRNSSVSDLGSFEEWQEDGHESYNIKANLKDALSEILDNLQENRDSEKINALKSLSQLLGSNVCTNEVANDKISISSNLTNCLRRKSTLVLVFALKCISLVSITLGADEEAYYKDIQSHMIKLLDSEIAEEIQVESLYSLVISCYVCCLDEGYRWDMIEICMQKLDYALANAMESLTIASLRCFSLLITFFPPSVVIPLLYDQKTRISKFGHKLKDLLINSDIISIRTTACEVLALLVEYKYNIAQGSWSYVNESVSSPIGGLMKIIEKLMHQSGKQIGKKNRKFQRSSLKSVLHTLNTGEGPTEQLTIGSQVYILKSWMRMIQLLVFRRCLQTGFQTHLQMNEFFHEMFEMDEQIGKNVHHATLSTTKTTSLTGLERRTYLSKRSDEKKLRSQNLKKSRRQRNRIQNSFVYDE